MIGDYVVTRDINKMFENRYGFSLSKNIKDTITQIEDEFLKDFKKVMDREIIVIDDLSTPKKKDNPFLSLDDVHLKECSDYTLSETRGVSINNLGGDTYEIPRPGMPSLDEQMEELRDGEFDLIDCGIFSGGTLARTLSKFKEYNITIGNIWMGLCDRSSYNFAQNTKNMGAVFSYELDEKAKLKPLTVPKGRVFNIDTKAGHTNCDWLELRDLLGFEGRSIDNPDNEIMFHCYWSDMGKKASIPVDKVGAVVDLSKKANANIIESVRANVPTLEYIDQTVNQKGKEYLLKTMRYK